MKVKIRFPVTCLFLNRTLPLVQRFHEIRIGSYENPLTLIPSEKLPSEMLAPISDNAHVKGRGAKANEITFDCAYLSFVSRSLQVKLEVHFDFRWQQVVHDCESDVLLIALVGEHPEKLWQQCVRVLVEVHVVAGQELLEKLRLLVLHRLQDELVVVCQVEDAPRRPRVAQFPHLVVAY